MAIMLGVGAQKSGTTWLCERLRLLPGVTFPFGKEAHVWDRVPSPSAVDIHAWGDALRAASADGVGADFTPAYSLLDVETIRSVREAVPGARVVLLLRNPIERAWSSARMALLRAEMVPGEASDAWFIDHVSSSGSLRRGDYLGVLSRWASVFPEEQVLVLFHDDILTDPGAVLGALCVHLGMDASPFGRMRAEDLAAPVFEGPRIPLPRAVHRRLLELYEPALTEMSRMPGWPAGRWLEAARAEERRHG